jgi:fructose-1,6-bisphosphatase II
VSVELAEAESIRIEEAVGLGDGWSHELRALEPVALAATKAAARACQGYVGRGDKTAADAAATEAMRSVLSVAPGLGTVVIGEGEKDKAPMLYNGEQLGAGGTEFEIAVDPLECTTFCAKGLPGSLATIAFASAGTLLRPGPSFYMEKLVVPSHARDAIDITDLPEANVRRIAAALGKTTDELRVVVLDKPRHTELIGRLHRTGVSVITPSDGDVAGALQAMLPSLEADALMGIGGTPEGVMTACAAKAVGAGMQGRLAPQSDEEARALAEAGIDTERALELDDLAGGPAFFAATGVTGGTLLRSPRDVDGEPVTESILISQGSVSFIEARLSGRGGLTAIAQAREQMEVE